MRDPITSPDSALDALTRLTTAALAAEGPEDVLTALLDALRATLAPDQLHLQLISQDGGLARGVARSADGGVERYLQSLAQPSGASHVVASGEPLNVPDCRASAAVRHDHVERWNCGSALFLPVGRPGDVQAVAIAVMHATDAFGDADVRVGRALTETATSAIVRIAAERRLEGEEHRHVALARAARALNESLDLGAVLAALSREATLAVGGDAARVFLADGTGGGTSVAGHGLPEGSTPLHLSANEGAGGHVLATGRAAVVDLPREDGKTVVDGIQTAVGVPVRWGGEVRGALCVGFFAARRVGPTEVESLEAIAELAALAWQNAEAYQRATRAASTDSLTGVLNHGAMQARVAEEISRARRDGTPLSCILVDLDDFKGLNDRAGHAMGDELLRGVARALTTAGRPYDQLARYGGDEFVLILPGADEPTAQEIAERAQEAIHEAGRRLGSGIDGQGSSMGVAQWQEPCTASELIERADRALLLAKRRGKGRAEIASAATDEQLALDAAGGRLMAGFWSLVCAAHDPFEALAALPALVRRELGVAEVALYSAQDASAGELTRLACARDSEVELGAFAGRVLELAGDAWARLEAGPLWRASLADLHAAIGATDRDLAGAAPDGAYAAVALARPGHPLALLVLRALGGTFPPDGLKQAWALAGQATAVLLGGSGQGAGAAVAALAAAIDVREDPSREHARDVVALACDVARLMGLAEDDVEHVRQGALLHDVGKMAIPAEVLLKPGPLDAEELALVRQHPIIGERLLRRVPELVDLAPVVRHEHERWDGGGYPDGLAGNAIPLASRIVLACDAFDAMITRRPYREPLAEDAALAELLRHAGTQFDPAVIDALVRARGAAGTAGAIAPAARAA